MFNGIVNNLTGENKKWYELVIPEKYQKMFNALDGTVDEFREYIEQDWKDRGQETTRILTDNEMQQLQLILRDKFFEFCDDMEKRSKKVIELKKPDNSHGCE